MYSTLVYIFTSTWVLYMQVGYILWTRLATYCTYFVRTIILAPNSTMRVEAEDDRIQNRMIGVDDRWLRCRKQPLWSVMFANRVLVALVGFSQQHERSAFYISIASCGQLGAPNRDDWCRKQQTTARLPIEQLLLLWFFESVFYTPKGPLSLRGMTYSEDDELEVRCFGFHVSSLNRDTRRSPNASWFMVDTYSRNASRERWWLHGGQHECHFRGSGRTSRAVSLHDVDTQSYVVLHLYLRPVWIDSTGWWQWESVTSGNLRLTAGF
jgi:hypothetical protein